MKRWLPLALSLLVGCNLHDDPKPDPKAAVQPFPEGRWEEYHEPMAFFAASFLEVEFDGSHVLVREKKYTDVIGCLPAGPVQECSDGHWSNFYAGTTDVKPGEITFKIHYIGTTANAMTRPEAIAAASTTFRWSQDAKGIVSLIRTGGDEFMWSKQEFALKPL